MGRLQYSPTFRSVDALGIQAARLCPAKFVWANVDHSKYRKTGSATNPSRQKHRIGCLKDPQKYLPRDGSGCGDIVADALPAKFV